MGKYCNICDAYAAHLHATVSFGPNEKRAWGGSKPFDCFVATGRMRPLSFVPAPISTPGLFALDCRWRPLGLDRTKMIGCRYRTW